MSEKFYEKPIINSPYECPSQHWELDGNGLPTHEIKPIRRPSDLMTPIPRPRQSSRENKQQELNLDSGAGISTDKQQYNVSSIINSVRNQVELWRQITDPNKWGVTPETTRLLQHWRHHNFSSIKPFFCQIEAVETAIWLTEVAPNKGKLGKDFLDHIEKANLNANPGLNRLALKLATGAGKTTVMAMIIAWQTINAVRRPNSKRFTKGFLVIAPGITIRERLQVLLPNDRDSYYQSHELVPNDLLIELQKAKIIITNYHAFKLRERMPLSRGGRSLLQGRGEDISTIETEGQMIQRVIPELMGMKNVLVINDEAHHCYREKPDEKDVELSGDEKKEAQKNKEAARLWISGIEIINQKIGVSRVMDLSATPFFLSGSGYVEGTLFPWTMSDFSLMDALECGIVKLPRVPIADNLIKPDEFPVFRDLWKHIGSKMPKASRGANSYLDPLDIPVPLQTALEVLYGHYEETYNIWAKAGIKVPPCFIVVCNNTATSKIIYEYISGHIKENSEGTSRVINGRLKLFQNYDEYDNSYPSPKTILIDSQQLESGEVLDKNFRNIASTEIEQFRRDIIERTGDRNRGENITDQELLREVMNTVGKQGRLGESVRCVVSVSMLTEGWDANNVTHILGVRAFGTQLLCEQVIGRALRRQSYDLNEENLFNVEYADILGIPFNFAAEPVVVKPQEARETIQVKAMRPERDELEIQFPKVMGYRIELPKDRLTANFDKIHNLVLNPDIINAPSVTENRGIIGEGVNLNLVHTGDLRKSTLIFYLTRRLLVTKWKDAGEEPKLHLFGQLKRITKQWLDNHLICEGGTYQAQLMYQSLADMACDKITAGITSEYIGERPVKVMLDPYNQVGSTNTVNFTTSQKNRHETDPNKSHVNWAILDSDWEGKFCQVAESHPLVISYVKNHNMGFEVPYRKETGIHRYIPDFIVQLQNEDEELINLIVEIKGFRRQDADDKKMTMETYWVPGVNNHGGFGKWAFAEFTEIYQLKNDFDDTVKELFDKMVEKVIKKQNLNNKTPKTNL
jgi:type III restriction enzyme